MKILCERAWWTEKSMGYNRLWDLTAMGYDSFDSGCSSVSSTQATREVICSLYALVMRQQNYIRVKVDPNM
jgi:hypothetical protein